MEANSNASEAYIQSLTETFLPHKVLKLLSPRKVSGHVLPFPLGDFAETSSHSLRCYIKHVCNHLRSVKCCLNTFQFSNHSKPSINQSDIHIEWHHPTVHQKVHQPSTQPIATITTKWLVTLPSPSQRSPSMTQFLSLSQLILLHTSWTTHAEQESSPPSSKAYTPTPVSSARILLLA